jgi:ribose transport system permease protein
VAVDEGSHQQNELAMAPGEGPREGGDVIGIRGLRRVFQVKEMGVVSALIIICVVMSFASPYFFTGENIFNVMQSMSTIGIMAIGETTVLVAGGLDLSVGSILAVSAMFTARLMTYNHVAPWLAVAAGIVIGLCFGLANGLIVTKVKINPFITTLGMLSIARGLTYLLASGLEGTVASNIPMRDQGVNFLGAGYIGPVPFAAVIMLVLVVMFSLFMANTVLGRQIYATGSNEQAARLSGVDVDRVRLFTYMVTGALCALAGIMTAGLLSTSATNLGVGSELDVVAATIIGGTSLSGGEGTVYGAIIGAAIMAVVHNAFVLLGFPLHLQTVTIGLVIILAVGIDRVRRTQV